MRETYYIQEPHEEIQKTIPQYLNRDFFNIKNRKRKQTSKSVVICKRILLILTYYTVI